MESWLAGFDLGEERYRDRLREAEQFQRVLGARWTVQVPFVLKVLLLLFL